jgi:VanZ family protein
LGIPIDKWEHCIAYFVLTATMIFECKRQLEWPEIVRYCLFITLVFSFSLGVIIEFLQKYITVINRTASLSDVFANTTGIILALIAYIAVRLIFRNKKILLAERLNRK